MPFPFEFLALLDCVEYHSLGCLPDLSAVMRSVSETIYFSEISYRSADWEEVYADLRASVGQRADEIESMTRALLGRVPGLSSDSLEQFSSGYWRLEVGLAMLRRTTDELMELGHETSLSEWLRVLHQMYHLIHYSALNTASLRRGAQEIATKVGG